MRTNQQFSTPFCWWRCPLCGDERATVRNDPDCQFTANHLRTHIREADDSVHGPKGSYPPTLDSTDLNNNVFCDR